MSPKSQHTSTALTRRRLLQGTLGGLAGLVAWQGWPRLQVAMAQKGEPTGQMTWAIHVNIAPTWFDPAETPGIITPYMFLYAMHDALVKPMPDNPMSPCLATRWSESEDGLTYDFELRQGVKFHNGDPFTAEDVKFSFERYKGAGAPELKKKVKAVEIVTPHQVRFQLHEPWPDFLTFYASPATGAGWIVPKNYTEKIGSDEVQGTTHWSGAVSLRELPARRRAGAGSQYGLLAQDAARQTPGDEERPRGDTTRLAMLKKQEADVTYGPVRCSRGRGAARSELEARASDAPRQRNGLSLPNPTTIPSPHGLTSGCGWRRTTRSTGRRSTRQRPWATRSCRGASSRASSSMPCPWSRTPTIPRKPSNCCKEAGHPNGFDAGECGVRCGLRRCR